MACGSLFGRNYIFMLLDNNIQTVENSLKSIEKGVFSKKISEYNQCIDEHFFTSEKVCYSSLFVI